MKCGHCGNEVANPESGYCPYCGRKLGKDAETPEKPSGNENTPSEDMLLMIMAIRQIRR